MTAKTTVVTGEVVELLRQLRLPHMRSRPPNSSRPLVRSVGNPPKSSALYSPKSSLGGVAHRSGPVAKRRVPDRQNVRHLERHRLVDP